MEGITHEMSSLTRNAGIGKRQEIGKLIGFYEQNSILIDGQTEGGFTEDKYQLFRIL